MKTAISEIKNPVQRLAAFIKERDRIYIKRLNGRKPPWTNDQIIGNGRFCNVYREQDKVTIWIRENWRTPHADDPDLWFAMCVARLQNQPKALEALGYPVPWRNKHYLDVLHGLKEKGERTFNAAYIVSTQGHAKEKLLYLADDVLTPLWKSRQRLRPKKGDTLNSYHMLLGQFEGFGSFMTAQVIADLKYVEPLLFANDWDTFAASGPGSRKGMNYVMGRDPDSPWREDDWRMELQRLRVKLKKLLRGLPDMHAQDTQNCLCEFSKYMRAATIGQMPKQKFSAGTAYMRDREDESVHG